MKHNQNKTTNIANYYENHQQKPHSKKLDPFKLRFTLAVSTTDMIYI